MFLITAAYRSKSALYLQQLASIHFSARLVDTLSWLSLSCSSIAGLISSYRPSISAAACFFTSCDICLEKCRKHLKVYTFYCSFQEKGVFCRSLLFTFEEDTTQLDGLQEPKGHRYRVQGTHLPHNTIFLHVPQLMLICHKYLEHSVACADHV